MTRKGYRKGAQKPSVYNFNDHTNHRPLRKKMNQINRRRLNAMTKEI